MNLPEELEKASSVFLTGPDKVNNQEQEQNANEVKQNDENNANNGNAVLGNGDDIMKVATPIVDQIENSNNENNNENNGGSGISESANDDEGKVSDVIENVATSLIDQGENERVSAGTSPRSKLPPLHDSKASTQPVNSRSSQRKNRSNTQKLSIDNIDEAEGVPYFTDDLTLKALKSTGIEPEMLKKPSESDLSVNVYSLAFLSSLI